MDQPEDDNTTTIGTQRNDTTANNLGPSNGDENDDFRPNPWEEPCGFVLHLFALLSAILYSTYVLSLYGSFALNDGSLRDDVTAPIPAWTWIIPLSLVILFFAAPMIYGLLNASTVVLPHTGALSILQDTFSIVPTCPSPLRRLCSQPSQWNSSDPLFLNYVQRYYRRPMEWKEPSPAGTSTEESLEYFNAADDSTNRSIPAIVDIDVADINDWVSWHATVTANRTTS